MWFRNRDCSYRYTVKIDLNKLVNEIYDNLPGGNYDDWEYEGDCLKLEMSDKALADIWFCKETFYEPSEYDVDLHSYVEEIDVKKEILKALHEIDDIDVKVDVNEESIEIEEVYPDPDREYDRWKERDYE